MKWLKLEMQITKDGQGNETVSILPGNPTEHNGAVTDFHTSMGSLRAAVDAGTLDGATCLVINSDGGIDTDHCEHYPDNVVEGA